MTSGREIDSTQQDKALEALTNAYEDKAYVATAFSYFLQAEKVDKLISWLLAFIGGTTALLITNIDKIANLVGLTSIKVSLVLLLLSGIFAVLSKINGNTVQWM